MADLLSKTWGQLIRKRIEAVQSAVNELAPSIDRKIDEERAFAGGMIDLVITQGDKRALLVITYELLSQSLNDPQVLREALMGIVTGVLSQPEHVYLVTTAGIRKSPIAGDQDLPEGEGWQRYEDEASFVEGDLIAGRLLGTGHAGKQG